MSGMFTAGAFFSKTFALNRPALPYCLVFGRQPQLVYIRFTYFTRFKPRLYRLRGRYFLRYIFY